MKTQIKNLNESKVRMDVEIEPGAVSQRHEEVMEEFQKRAKLKGFREGKAPLHLVAKVYEKEADDEVLHTLIQEGIREGLKDSQVELVGSPVLNDVKWDKGKSLSFSAVMECIPQFQIKTSQKIQVTRPRVKISSEDVKEAITQLRSTRGELQPLQLPRSAQSGDVLRCDIDKKHEDKTESQEDAHVPLDSKQIPQFWIDALVGAAANEVRIIQHENTKFTIRIKEIKEQHLPELNDAFAKSFGKNDMHQLELAVGEDLRKREEERCRQEMLRVIYEELLDKHPITVPEIWVNRYLDQLKAEPQNKEVSKEKLSQIASRQIKLYVILDKVAIKYGLIPSDDEIKEAMKQKTLNKDEVKESLQRRKVDTYLIDHANIKETNK